MNAKQTYFLLVGLLVLSLVGLLGGTYVLNSFLGSQATKLADLKLQAQSLSDQQTSLNKAKKDITTYATLYKITQQIVPQDKDQAEAVREIVNIAAAAGVQLTSISFPASNLGALGSAPVAGAPGSSAISALTAKPSLSQLIAVPNTPGVYQLLITVQNDTDTEVTYSQFYNFLSGLEHNRRTAETASIIIQPDATNRRFLTFTLSLNEYIKP